MDTAEVLKSMFVEDTGRAMCDSGGYPSYDEDGNYAGSSQGYGRSFERNRGRDFEVEPTAWLSFDISSRDPNNWWLDLTISAYHWLKERVEFAEDLDKSFHDFANLPEHKDDYWSTNFADWLEHLNKNGHIIAAENAYGGGCNTYNHECLLSQTLQFDIFEIENSDKYETGRYVWLQVHGGCDVRGGYTAPRVFKLDDWEEGAMYDFARATIRPDLDTATDMSCNKNQLTFPGMPVTIVEPDNVYWDTYDGYNWESETGLDLKDLKASYDPEDRGNGKIYVDEDGNGYCPITGGKLEAYAR
jgi:hypothetical protein